MVSILLILLAIATLIWTLREYVEFPTDYTDLNNRSNSTGDNGNREEEKRTKWDNWGWLYKSKREQRRDYYRNIYLKSDAWQRKRYVVLRRDNWKCVYCGGRATQVHHKKYARKNIGKEPIAWLVSVCKSCHVEQHS